jgi:hypothetical protein
MTSERRNGRAIMAIQTTTGIELFGDDLGIVVVAGLTRKVRIVKSVVLEGFAALDADGRARRLAEAVRVHRISGSNVHLALPGNSGTLRPMDIPAAASNAPENVVALQLESISPWPVEDIWWAVGFASGRPSGSGKTKAPMRKAMVSIIPADVARPWVELFQRAGLPLAGLSLAPAAWAEGLTRLFGSDRPAMSVAVFPDRIEGVLIVGDRTAVVTETMPRPVDAPTRSTLVARAVAGLIRGARVEDPDSVRLVARGPIPEDFEPLALATLPVEKAPAGVGYFGALSVALAGRGRGSNLIPPADREGRNVVRLVPTIALAACLLIAVTALVVREPYQYMRYGERLDAEIARLAPLVDGVIAEDSELLAASEEYATLNAVLVPDRNLEALAWLAGSMPIDTWITSYSNQNGVLTVSGYSSRTSDFQLLLEESDRFDAVELASAVTRDPAGRERFTIRMNVAGAS